MILWLDLQTTSEQKGKLILYAEVGPLTDHKQRAELIAKIGAKTIPSDGNAITIGFQTGAAAKDRRYSRFFKKNSIPVSDITDVDEVASKIRLLLKKAQPAIEAVGQAISTLDAVKAKK